jgi:hypothetical protein
MIYFSKKNQNYFISNNTCSNHTARQIPNKKKWKERQNEGTLIKYKNAKRKEKKTVFQYPLK